MNDRFKFRFFDKKNNIMHKPRYWSDHFEFNAKGDLVCIDFSKFLAQGNDNFIVMQCTGLKDKNGKLIYEADIVKTDFKFSTVTVNPFLFDIGDVAFSEYFGGWVINSKENPAPYQQARLGKIDAENCEVIGNIYENKELLEDK